MLGNQSEAMHQEMDRLFSLGAIGTLSDALLLDRFVAKRDEAAFEELVIRHGPMVLRVCRSALRDTHDAEDAFQAIFLVLANRAKAIRRSESVASWLFGVALRVALRSKRVANRHRALDQTLAERTGERYFAAEADSDCEILHEEINGLPAHLRVPIVLCYLQGLTYAAAALQLGVSETAIRGRLARARKLLQRQLSRRGVTMPAALLAAGAVGKTEAAIPSTLIHSTVRIAHGFLAAHAASVLARGILKSMLLSRLKSAIVVLCVSLAGSLWAWHTFARAFDDHGPTGLRGETAKTQKSAQPPRVDRYGDPLAPGAAMRLGTVQFRQAPRIGHIVYSPDGRLVATDAGQGRMLVRDGKDGKPRSQIDPGIENIGDSVFSPDGHSVAVVGFELEAQRKVIVNHLVLADAARGRVIHRWRWDDQDSVARVAYGSDGNTVAAASLDGTLRVWDVATRKLLHQERLVEKRVSPESIAFSPARVRLLAIATPGMIDLWEVGQLRRVRRVVTDADHRPHCVVFSPDGKILATVEANTGAIIRLWHADSGRLLRQFKSRNGGNVLHMAFSPDGKVLAAIGGEGPITFFDSGSGNELSSFAKECSSGMGFDLLADSFSAEKPLAFSPDGTTLAATGSRESLHFWDLATGNDRLATPDAHLGALTGLACLLDGKTLVSGAWDRTVRIWDLTTGRSTRILPHDRWVQSLAVSADGSWLATGAASGKVRLWKLDAGAQLHIWSVSQEIIRGVAFSRDPSSVIAALSDGTLRRWDVATGRERPIAQPRLEIFPNEAGGLDNVSRAIFSRDGRSLAMLTGGWVQVFDVDSGDRRFKATLGAANLQPACEFAPNGGSLALVRESRAQFHAGRWLGSRATESTIVWLGSQTGSVRREITIPGARVRALTFSPDGHSIAYGASFADPARGVIRIVRLRDKRELQTIDLQDSEVDVLCFTPNGKRIAAGLRDTSIGVWDVNLSGDPR
jgi:RNA polymerase sigma factor (sigma-70 family)